MKNAILWVVVGLVAVWMFFGKRIRAADTAAASSTAINTANKNAVANVVTTLSGTATQAGANLLNQGASWLGGWLSGKSGGTATVDATGNTSFFNDSGSASISGVDLSSFSL